MGPKKRSLNKGKQPTYLEVSRLAKVSPATVTRVLSGASGVSRDLQAKVRRAAQTLGVDLHNKKLSRVVGFFLSNRDVLHPFQARILLGAETYCASQGWEMLFLSFHYPLGAAYREIHLPQVVNQGGLLRGIILSGTNSPGLLLSLQKKGIPFAVSGNNVIGEWQTSSCDVVSSDDAGGAYELTRDLIAQGHRSIWYIGDLQLPWYARCADGYRGAMAAAGLEPRIQEVHAADRELGYLAAKSILTRPVTAIFAGNDQVAVGVYRALGEAGVSIPGDISVAGFNDTVGENLYPRLTSVREFPEELGKHLAELVLRRIGAPDAEPQQVQLPTQIVRRESSGAPGAGRDRVSSGTPGRPPSLNPETQSGAETSRTRR